MTPIVQLDHVSKKYRLGLTRTSLPALATRAVRQAFSRNSPQRTADRDLWALKDVSLELAAGESMALVGANGAGKSTLLKLLSRITRPTEGRISVNGRLAALIELGSGFHPDLTGRENIYLNGSILGLSRSAISRRFDEIVAFSELEEFIDTPIKRYSSGMEVRLGFSVAACVEPEILLVDEVLSVGDTVFREKSMQRIRRLAENGTSIIFVSHNLYMAQAVCKTGVYLQRGRVLQLGSISDVIDAYERDVHIRRAAEMRQQVIPDGQQVGSGAIVEITSVTVQRPEAPGAELQTDGPAAVSVHYHANRDVSSVNLVAFIVRSDGVVCCMVRSRLQGTPLRLVRGTGTFSFELHPLQVLPGTYYMQVTVTDESDSIRLTPQPVRSGWFLVTGRIVNPGLQAGVFAPVVRWGVPDVGSALNDHDEAPARVEGRSALSSSDGAIEIQAEAAAGVRRA